MSVIRDGRFCHCDCHNRSGRMRTVHCVPCCDGQCKRCHRYVMRGRMAAHQAEHEASIKRLMDDPHKTEE